jgi:hypothetical protein
MSRPSISDYSYTKEGYENTIPGNEEIKAYWYEAVSFPRVDTNMDSSIFYNSVYKKSPQILRARPNAANANSTYNTTYGGPWYVEVGREIPINFDNSLEQLNGSSTETWI